MNSNDDKLKRWKTVTRDVVFETPWFEIRKQHMKTPAGAEVDYFIHDAQDSVVCVCVRDDNMVLIERQFRPPIDKVSVDYPAGRMEKDDATTEAAIRREIQEETGFVATSIKKLAVVDKEPGFSSSRMHIFVAQGTIAADTHLDETESIQEKFIKPSEVLELIESGAMSCTFCVSATFYAFRELGWLKTNV